MRLSGSSCCLGLVLAGSFLVAFGCLELERADLGQLAAQAQWETAKLLQSTDPNQPTPATRQDAPFLLSFPRLGIERFVLTGSDEVQMKQGPLWLSETAPPGDVGNSVIAGHRNSHFEFLRHVRRGDAILITRNGQLSKYAVEAIYIVDSSDRQGLVQQKDRRLTLVTCYPFSYIGPAPQRFIIQAAGI